MSPLSKTKAIDKLKASIITANELKAVRRFSPEFEKWKRNTEVAIEHIFGNSGRHIEDFSKIRYSLGAYSSSTPDSRFQEAYIKGIDIAINILQSMIDEINEYHKDDPDVTTLIKDKPDLRTTQISFNKVFIVHGKDEGMKQSVARMLEKLDLEAIILHEQANLGKTLIEKFEKYSDVSFAVILLSPDDMAYKVNDDAQTARPRAPRMLSSSLVSLSAAWDEKRYSHYTIKPMILNHHPIMTE
jgi:hypothetical protein